MNASADTAVPDRDFQTRAAALLRAAANDLKRNDANAEDDLDLPRGTFSELTSGARPVTWDLIRKAARVWPLNERDLLPVHDDCPAGVRIVRVKESVASARVIERGAVPYYEYRDTAMSRISSYRPEWIRMLQVVGDDDPENPDVRWNNGHLLYQFTYFIGPVNYYYRWGAEKRCVPMNTGDSVWGLPYAPHSFTARTAAEPALILALTYGGSLVGDAQRELSVTGPEVAATTALPPGPQGRAALLRSFLDSRITTVADIAERAAIPIPRAAEVFSGAAEPTWAELSALADAFGVNPRELLPGGSAAVDGVAITPHARARTRLHPDPTDPAYRLTALAGDRLHPHTTAFEVEALRYEESDAARLTTYQHQYLYVLGESPVRLTWVHGGRSYAEVLEPGDSAYLRPQLPAALLATELGTAGKVLLLRIGGAVTTEVRFGLGAMAEGGVNRYLAEDRLWYRPNEND